MTDTQSLWTVTYSLSIDYPPGAKPAKPAKPVKPAQQPRTPAVTAVTAAPAAPAEKVPVRPPPAANETAAVRPRHKSLASQFVQRYN
jgi:hypothetical protein